MILPLGSIEQHGSHLPVDTDIFLATAVAEAAAARAGRILVAPPLPFGQSAAHVPLGGTLTLRAETMLDVLRDLITSIRSAGFRHVLLLNGHNGNKPLMQIVVSEFVAQHGMSVAATTYYDLAARAFERLRRAPTGSDAHAGELETAMQLHLRRDRVSMPAAVARPMRPLTDFDARDLVVGGVAIIGNSLPARFPEGVAGDPTVADAEVGRALFDEAVGELVRFAAQYLAATDGRAG